MTFTIEELEALKEGTTPGPWVVKRENPTMQCDYFSIHRQGDHRTRIRGHVNGHGQDPELIAASPALLDQLIATERENARLRRGIEELRDSYEEDSGTVGSTQEEQIELDTHGETAKILTQILKEWESSNEF